MDTKRLDDEKATHGMDNDGIGRRHSSGPRQLIRFLFFGSVNTLVAYGVYIILLLFLSYSVAYTVSYVSGVLISYCLNAKFVFNEKLRVSTALQYPIIYVVQYFLAMLILHLLIEVCHVSKFAAPFIVALVTIPVAYKLSYVVIKRRTHRNPT
jgi:putative flippase GtrA